MKNGVIVCRPPGCLLGNATMCWLFAKAHAERVGAELVTKPWIGQKVWNLTEREPTAQEDAFPVRSDVDLQPDETNVVIRAYAQHQRGMIYTKTQAREWLKFRYSLDEVLTVASSALATWCTHIAHRRVGDFKGKGSLWPIVSQKSIEQVFESMVPESVAHTLIVSQEEPLSMNPKMPEELSMLGDFMALVEAKRVLIRSNSSFSWVAALLSDAEVWSPRIDGLTGGVEADVAFERGNHCKLGNFDLCSDLHVAN